MHVSDAHGVALVRASGAYLKFLEGQPDLAQMEEKSSYTVMFGPDKCGSTNKIHLILRFKNAKTGEYKEHHLKAAASSPNTRHCSCPDPVNLPCHSLAEPAADEERRPAPPLHGGAPGGQQLRALRGPGLG